MSQVGDVRRRLLGDYEARAAAYYIAYEVGTDYADAVTYLEDADWDVALALRIAKGWVARARIESEAWLRLRTNR